MMVNAYNCGSVRSAVTFGKIRSSRRKLHKEQCTFYTMGLFRWIARKLMSVMGNLYVWLDKRVEYTKEEVSSVLGIPIDDDLQTSSRYELCRRVEETFEVPKDSFWNLHSTQKIRFAVQMSRNLKKSSLTVNGVK